jgi:hypothetical protein
MKVEAAVRPHLCPELRAKAKNPQSADQGVKSITLLLSLERLSLPSCDGHKRHSFLQLGIPGGHRRSRLRSVDGKADQGISCRAQVPQVFAAGRVGILFHEEGLLLSGAMSAPDAISPLNCCRGG